MPSRPAPLINLSILSIEAVPGGVHVSWEDDEGAELSAVVEVTYERPDRSAGHNGGYSVAGPAPDWVLEAVAEWSERDARDAAEYASELRAELRAEAGW